jgi:aspartyl-tRNA(Asn)/glutamyl-tRNA(Gln) amidotransferase subunit B
LLPLKLDADWVEELRAALPELPDARKQRFMADYGLGADDAGVLVAENYIAEYFEQVAQGRDGKLAANWVMGELFGALNTAGLEISASPVSAEQLGGLVDRVADKTLSRRIAKEVFEIMFESGQGADTIIDERGLKQVSDSGAIDAVVDQVIADNPDKVAEYKGGKDKLIGWFVGQVMKASQGNFSSRGGRIFCRSSKHAGRCSRNTVSRRRCGRLATAVSRYDSSANGATAIPASGTALSAMSIGNSQPTG